MGMLKEVKCGSAFVGITRALVKITELTTMTCNFAKGIRDSDISQYWRNVSMY
jgi:hypothetical protein